MPDTNSGGGLDQMSINYKTIQQRELVRSEDKKRAPKSSKTDFSLGTISLYKTSNYFHRNIDELVVGIDSSVPVFVQQCVRVIESQGLRMEGLYRTAPPVKDRRNLLSKFDKDNSLDFSRLPENAHVVASGALKWFFSDKNMPSPLVPHQFQEELKFTLKMPPSSIRNLCLRGAYRKLPAANKKTLAFVCQHLNRVAANQEWTRMDLHNLATCWWPTLFHPCRYSLAGAKKHPDLRLLEVFEITLQQTPFIFFNQPEVLVGQYRPPAAATAGPR